MSEPKLHIVLFRPEIPHNTGAIGRLAVSTETRLHLITPLGFSLDEKSVKRSGLDYWHLVDLHLWDSLGALQATADPQATFWFFTTKTDRAHWDATFNPGDYLVFGPESRGLPEPLLSENPDTCVTLPMPGEHARSLNLATAAAIAVYEGLRQIR